MAVYHRKLTDCRFNLKKGVCVRSRVTNCPLLAAVPRRTLVAAFEQSAPGRKEPKQRVSILECCNATGSHQLKPLLIGKYIQKPSFRKTCESAHIACHLPTHQSNMWTTQAIFAEWFHNYFVPRVKIIYSKLSPPLLTAPLLVDYCSAHPRNLMSQDSAVRCDFLPPM